MVLVSAHRGGAGGVRSAENTLAAFDAAIALGCDYVELDVRFTSDGIAVVSHDGEVTGADGTRRSIADHRLDEIAGATLVTLDAVLELMRGRVGAHVDLKVRGREAELAHRVVDALGAGAVVITTAEDASVRRLVAWASEHAPGLMVGLSSSPRSASGRWPRLVARGHSAFARTRVRRSGATVVVAHRTLARWSLRAYARRRGLPLLVWTVDRPDELARWMNDPATWMVTTNHPARALAARR
jgi:glycerophosphoryl diester phosphodiesterase